MNSKWLIEYTEDEVSPEMKEQMKNHLDAMPGGSEALGQYEHIKKTLKMKNDEFTTFECDDAFFDKLHDKVMNAIEEKELLLKKSPKRFSKKVLFRMVASVAVICTIALLAAFKADLHQNTQDNIMQLAASSPDILAEMTSHQNSSDFFVDVANQNFNDLEAKDLKRIISKN